MSHIGMIIPTKFGTHPDDCCLREIIEKFTKKINIILSLPPFVSNYPFF
jgi:hypothetical protein